MLNKLRERAVATLVFEIAGVTAFYFGTVAALMYKVVETAGYLA